MARLIAARAGEEQRLIHGWHESDNAMAIAWPAESRLEHECREDVGRRADGAPVIERRWTKPGRASPYGTEGQRFESSRARYKDSEDRTHLQDLHRRSLPRECDARKLVSDSGRFSGDFFGDLRGALRRPPRSVRRRSQTTQPDPGQGRAIREAGNSAASGRTTRSPSIPHPRTRDRCASADTATSPAPRTTTSGGRR
jgi:hypothetical protein